MMTLALVVTSCSATQKIRTRAVQPPVATAPERIVPVNSQYLAQAPAPVAPPVNQGLQTTSTGQVLTYQNGQPVFNNRGVYQTGQYQQSVSEAIAPTEYAQAATPAPASKTTAKIPAKFSSWVLPSRKIVKTPKQMLAEGPNACALTFDDGPHKTLDPQILDILDSHGIRATFFLIAKNAKRLPELTKEMVTRGHEVANHSWDHDDQKKKSSAGQAKDLKRANKVFNELGIFPKIFRPPYGSFSKKTVSLARQEGMDTLLWTTDPEDWRVRNAAAIRARVKQKYKPGSVVLLHSIVPGTVKALPGIIEDLKAQNCQFVTSSEWIELVSKP